MSLALLLAILAQGADAAVTCHAMAHGGRELNPLVPQSCPGVIALKAGLVGATFVLPTPWKGRAQVGLAVVGVAGVGITVQLMRGDR